MTDHDRRYKTIFSFKEVVADLLRQYIDPALAAELDFDTLSHVNSTYITDHNTEQRSDVVWSINWRQKQLYLYIQVT